MVRLAKGVPVDSLLPVGSVLALGPQNQTALWARWLQRAVEFLCLKEASKNSDCVLDQTNILNHFASPGTATG